MSELLQYVKENIGKLAWHLPEDISTHGQGIDRLIHALHIFMFVLFVGWAIYLIIALIKFRARPGHSADTRGTQHFRLPKYIEIGVVIFEVFLLVFLSSPVWYRYKKEFPDEKDAVVVRMVAEQFAWNIQYAGKDGKFGNVKTELMDGTNPVGVDREDPAGKDDIVSINVFNVPVDKPVIVHLSSKDVIHSLFLPEARVKQDAIPGMDIPVWFQATKTGNYEIACAQLCGLGHYRMRGMFNVMTQADYDAWLAEEDKALTAE